MLEELECEQGEHLGLVRRELRHEAREANRLVGEGGAHEVASAAEGVALGEEQVEHGDHPRGALGQQVRRGHAAGNIRAANLRARAHQSLLHDLR